MYKLENYNKVVKEIEKTHKKIKANENKIDLLDSREKDLKARLRDALRNNNELLENNLSMQLNIIEQEYIKLCEQVYKDKLKLRFLDDNKKVNLYNDCKNALYDVFSKYQGKQYGERTKEKFKNDFKELTGCFIWIESKSYSSDKIHIKMPVNYSYDDVVLNVIYDKPILIDNKLMMINFDNITIYEQYHENINKSVNDLIKAHKKAIKAIEQAEQALKEYREASPRNLQDKINTYISNKPYREII